MQNGQADMLDTVCNKGYSEQVPWMGAPWIGEQKKAALAVGCCH